MISQISGKIRAKRPNSLIIDANGVSYEVLIPPAVMKTIDTTVSADSVIDLFTYHYFQLEPSRGVPVLIGFMNEIEREFFEQFITVSGVGPKAACKALSLPFSFIADAIDKGDIAFLKQLPGIGEQRAREIVAKLQGKVGKFGLIQDRFVKDSSSIKDDVRQEALSVLIKLQYRKKEAEDMIAKAIGRNPSIASCEEILNEVYRQRNG